MILRIGALSLFSLVLSVKALGCSCVPPPPTATTYRALAEWNVRKAPVIFEGTVERLTVSGWPIKPIPGANVSIEMRLKVSFSGLHSYRGEVPADAIVETGMGGGDCGYWFEKGKSYLVVAWKEDNGSLSTGICSGTTPLVNAGAELRVLRGEPPTSGDLKEWRARDDGSKPATPPPHQVCGKIALPN